MKLMGGDWSKGDFLAALGLIVAVIGVVAGILAIPGMPKIAHWDSEPSVKQSDNSSPAKVTPAEPTPKSVQKTGDVTSGQVNFGCEQTLPVETPVVSFGKNPRDINAKPAWANTANVKAQNQSVSNVEDPVDHHLVGVQAVGTITGLDLQNLVVAKNCPGGGHGELTLHVTWTEDQ
jgi:hypothetical protein